MRGLLHIDEQQTDRFTVARHRCASWEIIYYTKGSGVATIKGRRFPFTEGVIICVPPGVFCEAVSTDGCRFIHFIVEHMDDFDMEIPIFTDTGLTCRHLLTQLQGLYKANESRWAPVITSMLTAFCEYVKAGNSGYQKNPLVEAYERLVEENIDNYNFKPADFYSRLTVSKDHYIRLFKKETGSTPSEYLNQKRIGRAIDILSKRRENNIKMKDVAALCGFNDYFYFSRVFKKRTGYSPSDMFP